MSTDDRKVAVTTPRVTFMVDRFNWVYAQMNGDTGYVRSQSVEALLLLEILAAIRREAEGVEGA